MLVAAVGMTLVILCRQIDISIGSIFSVCGVVAGLLAQAACRSRWSRWGRWRRAACWVRSTAFWSPGLGLPSIVVTLATLVIWRESLRYAREGEFVRNLPAGFQWFGMGQAAGQWIVVAIALVVFAFSPGAWTTWRRADSFTRRVPTPRPPGWRAFGPGE